MGAMSKSTISVRKFSYVPKVTGSRICPKESDDPPPTPEKDRLGCSHSRGMRRRLKVSTESMLRPAPPSTRVLVTATWQMVGVHNRGSAPEPTKLAGWSSELKVRPTSRAARPVGAPCRAETTPIWRANGLTWWLVGGVCEPPRKAATTGSIDVVVQPPGRIGRRRGGACCLPLVGPVAVLTAGDGERRG